jgi:hypothetical protein
MAQRPLGAESTQFSLWLDIRRYAILGGSREVIRIGG